MKRQPNIIHRDRLLQHIVSELKQYSRTPLYCIKVVFVCDDEEEYDFNLQQALDTLINDLFFDERGNWSKATSCRIEII